MICTISLIVINVIVFVLLSFGGMTEDATYMLEHGAMYLPYFMEQGEYYRIFTSLFLHFGFEHLMSNMVVLAIMGKYLEPLVGKFRFVFIYFVSGLAGNVLSSGAELLTKDYAVSAGASGAIFGVTGALLALAIIGRGRVGTLTKQDILVMVAVNLYIGFTSQGVDNLAHIGGLLGGMLITFLLCPKKFVMRQNREGTLL